MAPRSKAGAVRKRTLAAIHAGARQLGWDDEQYRGYLQTLIGVDSASAATDAQLTIVINDMRRVGFTRKPGAPARSAEPTQLDKARAIWSDLGALGELTSPTEAAFCAFVERMTHKSRPEWCTPEDLQRVIEALKSWFARLTPDE